MQTIEKPDLSALIEQMTKQHNAQILEHKKLFALKYPNTIDPASLLAPATDYPIKSYRFDYWAAFYIQLECYLTYGTGQVMQFHGKGGGVGVGSGIYAGANDSTSFSLSPSQLVGDCSWYFQPVAIGALLHFWRGDTAIGTLIGAGIGTGLAFGGSGTWSAG